MLDGNGIAISTATNHQHSPAVAWNGSIHLVVWMDFRSGSTFDIYGTTVSAAGDVRRSDIQISAATGNQSYPRGLSKPPPFCDF